MANIGLSIESGAMNAVLFDSEADKVVASQTTTLKGGEPSSLSTAVQAMYGIATRRGITVDATALVYRSEDERTRFSKAIADSELGDIELVSASTAFLGWLARSPEFDSSDCVLLYFLGASGVSVTLADARSESLTAPKTAVLDSMSPERIGSTVPLVWEVVDEAARKPTAVALFGDRSASPDVVDILALGLGVPVVCVEDGDEIAVRGAALLAAARTDSSVAAPVDGADPDKIPVSTTAASTTSAAAETGAARKADSLHKPAAVKKAFGTRKSGAARSTVAVSSARAAVKIVPTNTAVAKVAEPAKVTEPAKPASLAKSAKFAEVAEPAALAEPVSVVEDAVTVHEVEKTASTKLVPAEPRSAKPAPVKRVAPVASLAPTVASLPSVGPRAMSTTETAPAAVTRQSSFSRKKIVLTAALLAAVMSGGVALAAVLPTTTGTDVRDVAAPEATGIDTSLTGATGTVEVTQPAPPPALAPPPVAIDPVTQLPVVAQAPDEQWTIDPTTGVARPASERLTPIPASAIPPAAAVVPRATVEPPVFALPPIIPEAGKSQEQLEQEAWNRHWAHTAEWLQQEIVGN